MIPRRRIHIIKGETSALFRMASLKSGESSRLLREWEDSFAGYIQVKNAIAVGSGREGLRMILAALEMKRGDEVIIPAYTLKDLIGVITSLGLLPIPADIEPHTFNIAPQEIIKKISGRTRVILATHLFGMPCAMVEILRIAAGKGIAVIEDCAHACGAGLNGRKTGSFGRAAFFSFESIKSVNTYGGGMVVTDDDALAARIREEALRDARPTRPPLKKILFSRMERVFLPTPLSWIPLSLLASKSWHGAVYNFYRMNQGSTGKPGRPSAFQAWLGMEKIKTLDERVSSRRYQAELFKNLLDKRIIPQYEDTGLRSNYYFFVSLLPVEASAARRLLLNKGIDAGCGPEIADDCSVFLGSNDCGYAAQALKCAIQLPLHERISERDIRRISGALNLFLRR